MNDEIRMTNDEGCGQALWHRRPADGPAKADAGGNVNFYGRNGLRAVMGGTPMPRARAFTLIEVLVALAIIAVLLPAIMYSLSLESLMAATARNRTQAASLGTQVLNKIVADFPANGLGQSSGNGVDSGPQFARFTWTAALSDFPSDTVDGTTTFLQQIDVTVTWKESGQDRDLKLSTLVYQNTTASAGLTGGLTQ